jgi:hypothetical protein
MFHCRCLGTSSRTPRWRDGTASRCRESWLWLFGGVAELKGEPHTPRADFRIAVVGPLTGLAIGVRFGLVAWAVDAIEAPDLVVGVCGYLAGVNLMLALSSEGSGCDVRNAWVHFRAPDGNIYELTQDPGVSRPH